MSSKHLSVGSVCPPITPGLLRCYSMVFCPYAQRTRLVLAAKNIKHEIVNINLVKKPEWYSEKNPLTKVPALELHEQIMFESLVTADYLDEAYPGRQLHPEDKFQKGIDRGLMEIFGKVTSAIYKLYGAYKQGDAEEKNKSFDDLQNGLDYFEREINKRATTFFNGQQPGMLDYMIWPWCERLPAVESVIQQKLPASRFPKMESWMKNMKEDEAVKRIYIAPEIHKKFLEGALAGNPDYDMKY